ncbi:MAG TPA: alpha/beta fold hydrolase [Steroidobacteraceae bacterium]
MSFVLMMLVSGYLVMLAGCTALQRRYLYYPTHHPDPPGLARWRAGDQLLGYSREVAAPKNIWLMMHGNAGQASDRSYALAAFSAQDSVYLLEYPGYGDRPGAPSMQSINRATTEAYEILSRRFPDTPLCVVGESIGSGPASMLALNPRPPAKIVLITPFDLLSRVAADHLPLLPVRFLLRDNWNNIEALRNYQGPLEIFAARDDEVIRIAHARALAANKPSAIFHEIDGGHNQWSLLGQVAISNP